jgi:hypothetical protein
MKIPSSTDGNNRKSGIAYHDIFPQARSTFIWCTRSIDWVKRSAATPATEIWDSWLNEALQAVKLYGKTYFKN